jgi:long-chain acyl-CoA synthetase
MGEPILDLIPAERARTLYGLFRERVRRSPDKLAYRGYDREAKAWTDSSWTDMAALVGRWQTALAKEGLQPGDRVAIALRNCREWVAFDQAALGLGLVTVPLYCDDRADNVAYILNDCTAKLVLVENPRLWQRLAPALQDVASLQRILLLEAEGMLSVSDPRLRLVRDWLPGQGELVEDRGESKGLASIVYTSGTSGRSKGVMLSHWNMLSIAEASWKVVNVRTTDLFLSFLPLSHTFERTVGYYVALMAGAAVAHARSVNQLAEDLVEIKPTVLIAVPRIFERVHTRILQQMAKGPAIKKKLFDLTVQVGWERFEYQQGRRKLPSPLLALWPLLDRLVAQKVMEKLGGRVRASISGGAALPPAISKVFIALGLNLMQGYGLTEFSPVASVNPEHDNDPTTIGPPLPGVEARIGEDKELLLRGPGVMMGYWNNPAATKQAIDADGWLHTGDQAEFVGTHLRIIGRIKEIVVMSNGEKLPPADIEAAITLEPLFEQAMIIGEGKPYLTALVVLNPEQWPEVAAEHGLDPNDPAALNDSVLLQKMQARVTQLLRDFPGYAKVRRIALSLEPWSVDNGCLTATMKLKRNMVVQRYAESIELMYATAQRG